MFVSDLMTTPAVTVTARTSIKSAARLLRDRNVAAVPVLDDDGALVGIVSEIDLLRGTVVPDPTAHLLPVAPPEKDPPVTVAEVMSTDVQVLFPHSDLYDAACRMRVSGVRSLPVVQDGEVVGIVSRADLLRVLAREDDEIAADVQARFGEEFGAHVPCQVRVQDGVVTLTAGPASGDLEAAMLLTERVPGVVRVRTEPQV